MKLEDELKGIVMRLNEFYDFNDIKKFNCYAGKESWNAIRAFFFLEKAVGQEWRLNNAEKIQDIDYYIRTYRRIRNDPKAMKYLTG